MHGLDPGHYEIVATDPASDQTMNAKEVPVTGGLTTTQNFIFVPLCDCTGFCDLNQDGPINAVDVVILVNYVYKNTDTRAPLPVCWGNNGDWNCSATVNAVDVVLIVNYIYKASGQTPCDPCGL